MTVEATEASFARDVAAPGGAVVVEFYATWCGTCRRVAPTLEQLAGEYVDRVPFVKVNADENPALVARFAVSSTPTLFVLAGDQQLASVIGAQPEPVLRGLFETAATHQRATSAGSAREGGTRVEPAWVPAQACTLPAAQQPTRLAEFDALFASLRTVQRDEPGWLRLHLAGEDRVEELARDLTAREASCCSFFDFTVQRTTDEVVLDVRVPDNRIVVLDGLAAHAQTARAL